MINTIIRESHIQSRYGYFVIQLTWQKVKFHITSFTVLSTFTLLHCYRPCESCDFSRSYCLIHLKSETNRENYLQNREKLNFHMVII